MRSSSRDPWDGLLGYLAAVVRLQSSDRGFSEIIGAHFDSEQLLTRARTRIRPLVEELVIRAQAAGSLRPDVAYEDISVLLWTTGRVVDATRDVAPSSGGATWRCSSTASAPSSATPLPRPPLTPAKHLAAMQRFMQQRGRGQSQG